MQIFGPIPSRRLGQSLGINNIPHKVCSYSCIYCQVGRTSNKEIERRIYYNSDEIKKEVADKLIALTSKDEHVDYISIVPDGEPTLDLNLGYLIERLKTFGIQVVVFTNGSLLWRDDIKDDLSKADLVSIKIDTVDEDIWHRINQPFSDLELKSLLDGIRDFTKHYSGNVITETMFVQGLNDSPYSINNISEFISKLKIERSYLALPVRPPALMNLKAASMSVIDFALGVFGNNNIPATSLIQDTALDFSHTNNFIEELLSIISVHPMNRDAVDVLLKKANLGWTVMKGLLDRNEVVEVKYAGKKFYQRNFANI